MLDGLGEGTKRDALIEHGLQFHISAGDGVAHDHQVGARREVAFRIRLHDRDAQGLEQVRHGRIGGRIGTGDAIALGLQHAGKRRHRRAADADQVNVFGHRLFLRRPLEKAQHRCALQVQLRFNAKGEGDIAS